MNPFTQYQRPNFGSLARPQQQQMGLGMPGQFGSQNMASGIAPPIPLHQTPGFLSGFGHAGNQLIPGAFGMPMLPNAGGSPMLPGTVPGGGPLMPPGAIPPGPIGPPLPNYQGMWEWLQSLMSGGG